MRIGTCTSTSSISQPALSLLAETALFIRSCSSLFGFIRTQEEVADCFGSSFQFKGLTIPRCRLSGFEVLGLRGLYMPVEFSPASLKRTCKPSRTPARLRLGHRESMDGARLVQAEKGS